MRAPRRLVLPRGNFAAPAASLEAAPDLSARWRDLVDRRLPEAARSRADWPVRTNHGFARLLLDNVCDAVHDGARTAGAALPAERLAAALALGEAVLAGTADLARLDRHSLLRRGGRAAAPAPDGLACGDLRLRRWGRADDAPYAAMNADPEVMAHFARVRSRAESVAEARALDRRFDTDGFGPWAVEEAGRFVGFVGSMRVMRAMPFAGAERPGTCVEIGWRLASAAWGRGIATRAARLALADLFGRCGIGAVVAYTAAGNQASRRVMERLGMTADGRFAHPLLPCEHPLSLHLLYRLEAEACPGGRV